MKNKNQLGKLYIYLKWPLIVAVYFAIVIIFVNIVSPQASYVLGIFWLIYVVFAAYIAITKFNSFEPTLMELVEKAAKAQGVYASKLSVPYAVASDNGRIIWANEAFEKVSDKSKVGNNLMDIFPELNQSMLSNIKEKTVELLSVFDDKKYRIHLDLINMSDMEKNGDANLFAMDDKAIMVYLYDETAYYDLKQVFDNNKQVTGYIYIDNFYEVAENMEDSKASMLIAMVDRKLTRYISYNSGILKKLEKDKYFFITTKKDIEDMIADRFSILEQTKEIIGSDNTIPLTLSIGVGYEGKSIESNHELAKLAIDMALGRGGDQAVVKKGQETTFYGGKSASTTSNLRVRARVKATSFKETLDMKDKVLIMGHKYGDFDSFGASIGTYIMAKHLGKDVHIVVNSLTNAVSDMKERFLKSDLYDKTMFINGDTALEYADNNTLLIIVDHNVGTVSDEPRLLDNDLDLVLFDHHRISANSISESILSYIDAGASSTCEIVAELMIYFEDRLSFKQLEADSMIAGIMIDTNNFMFQTSSKTFDAAAYLKKKGADTDRVKKLLRVDMTFEKYKNEAISNAEIYRDGFAIVALDEAVNGIEEGVAKAKIANELINVKDVKASFVLCLENGKYSISCRSIDEMNVQVLMEKLGGGGHRSAAGTLIEANSFDEAKEMLKREIDSYIDTEGR